MDFDSDPRRADPREADPLDTDRLRRRRGRTGAGIRPLLVALAAGLGLLGGRLGDLPGGGASVATASAGTRTWSAPRIIAECELAYGPQIAFPSESPFTPTGAGAIVWASDPSPCGSPSAHGLGARWGVSVAALGSTDAPKLKSTVSLRRAPNAAGVGLATVGASAGRVVLAAAPHAFGAPASPATVALQGLAGGPFGSPVSLSGPGLPVALTRAYLGDVAIASVVPGPAIAVRVERYFKRGFGRVQTIPIRPGLVSALTATMDYRSDVLVTWQQNGAIYAHMLRASGRVDPTQRVGPSAPEPQLQAVVSDNDHGMIAWSSSEARQRSGTRTRIYLDLSSAGVRFGAPRVLASFADPQQSGRSPGSLALVRLSTENVMLAWTAVEHGSYVVRANPAVFAATRPTVRLSNPGEQSVLAGLAPGPADEAVALWRSAPRLPDGRLDQGRTALWTARTWIGEGDRLQAGPPEMIAAQGPNAAATVAVDPANDRAVAAWRTLAAPQRIEYALGAGDAGYRRRALPATASIPGPGTHWLRITLAVGGAAAAVTLLAVAIRLRRRSRDV
ncbi:MAG TPA: hypothetical protein VES65_03700 [Solirubrobacteraceae bacterium]|nr:hypothetical protein [Solirubrobacteraceae bacterium]